MPKTSMPSIRVAMHHLTLEIKISFYTESTIKKLMFYDQLSELI